MNKSKHTLPRRLGLGRLSSCLPADWLSRAGQCESMCRHSYVCHCVCRCFQTESERLSETGRSKTNKYAGEKRNNFHSFSVSATLSGRTDIEPNQSRPAPPRDACSLGSGNTEHKPFHSGQRKLLLLLPSADATSNLECAQSQTESVFHFHG